MKLKKIYDMNKITVYNKFNFLFAFCLLQFFAILLLGSIILGAIIENPDVFIVGLIIFFIGIKITTIKYIIDLLKIRKLKEEPKEEIKEQKIERRILI